MKKFYKTIIQVEVLSEEPFQWNNLSDVNDAITDGNCSGKVTEISSKTLNAEEVREALTEHRTDPDFFDTVEHD